MATYPYASQITNANGGTVQDFIDSTRYRLVYPEDFGAVGDGVADDTSAVQEAIYEAEGGEVIFRPGAVYRITSPLLVRSNTIITAGNSTVLRGGEMNNIIRNDSDGTVGGYGASRNITINGGVWDGNDFALNYGVCTGLTFGHSTDIRIFNAVIKRIPHWHHIEINACSGVWIDKCVFQDGASAEVDTGEAIQLDHASNSTSFPWFGPYDGTANNAIRITNCYFDNNSSCIGTHSAPGTGRHQDIIIDGCTFYNPYAYAIRMCQWSGARVTNNRFQGGYTGILMESASSQVPRDILIEGNTFFNIGATSRSGTDGACIDIKGTSAGARYQDVRIAGNTMIGMNSDHGGSALVAFYTDRMVVTGNIIHNPILHGMWLQGIKYSTIASNTCYGASGGSHDIHVGYSGDPSGTVEVLVIGNTCGILGMSNTTRSMFTRNICGSLSSSGTHNNGNISENLVNGSLA